MANNDLGPSENAPRKIRIRDSYAHRETVHTTHAATPLQAAQEWANARAAGGRSLDAFAEGVVIQDVLTGREWEFYTDVTLSVKAVLVDPEDVSEGACTVDAWEGA